MKIEYENECCCWDRCQLERYETSQQANQIAERKQIIPNIVGNIYVFVLLIGPKSLYGKVFAHYFDQEKPHLQM